MTRRIEVLPRVGGAFIDSRGESIQRQLSNDHGVEIGVVRSTQGYLIEGEPNTNSIEQAAKDLFSDPIIEDVLIDSSFVSEGVFSTEPEISILIGFKAGVTDNRGQAAIDGFTTLFPENTDVLISTTVGYYFWDVPSALDADWLAAQLYNPLIERAVVCDRRNGTMPWPQLSFPAQPPLNRHQPAAVNLEISDDALIQLSDEGILSLSLTEMKAIQSYHRDLTVQENRKSLGLPPFAPTDVEIECLAQSWSEHCKHKIFSAKIHHTDTETGEDTIINSLFKTYITSPALEMQKECDWLLSLFHDNSGVIAWTDEWSLCMKVETHNSPSALDPFGGAMTGIVGVNRDIIGTGLGARPIANTDVFCFGPPDYSGDLPEGLFHPSRVLRGVHAGVRAGGNESGIPTVNGAFVFDERYIGKPLVYCGTIGLMPRYLSDGRESHTKTPSCGDIIYMVGGRVGGDGIHGATFSSLELTEESPSTAVQIGDPITQKKMLDMLLSARDANLIQVITDNGAGGLSSSVGEMAAYTGGADIDLGKVPLKRVGLSAWEILVSESQERMTVGINQDDVAAFESLADLHEVEVTEIGSFTDSGTFCVRLSDQIVASIPLSFLHDGCPQMELESTWTPPRHAAIDIPDLNPETNLSLLDRLLATPDIASKEWWVRSYDHEVIGQTVIKPFGGANNDGPNDAAVIAPIHGQTKGVVISCGIIPKYSDIDAHAMAAASIDEAVRNAVCVGVNLDKIAGLDNFCWPDPVESSKTPDGRYKLAQLVRANRAIEQTCRAYNLPCISGKDSMKNDAVLDGRKISVPPTLLFSLIGDHPDVRTAVSSDFKEPGDIIYLLGETHHELGATSLAYLLREEGRGGIGGEVPRLDPYRNMEMYRSLSNVLRLGMIQSAHDCSEGGLSVSLSESCFGTDGGANIDISPLLSNNPDLSIASVLFGESLGRILVSVTNRDAHNFEVAMRGVACLRLGNVIEDDQLLIKNVDTTILDSSVSRLKKIWQSTLDGSEKR